MRLALAAPGHEEIAAGLMDASGWLHGVEARFGFEAGVADGLARCGSDPGGAMPPAPSRTCRRSRATASTCVSRMWDAPGGPSSGRRGWPW